MNEKRENVEKAQPEARNRKVFSKRFATDVKGETLLCMYLFIDNL